MRKPGLAIAIFVALVLLQAPAARMIRGLLLVLPPERLSARLSEVRSGL